MPRRGRAASPPRAAPMARSAPPPPAAPARAPAPTQSSVPAHAPPSQPMMAQAAPQQPSMMAQVETFSIYTYIISMTFFITSLN